MRTRYTRSTPVISVAAAIGAGVAALLGGAAGPAVAQDPASQPAAAAPAAAAPNARNEAPKRSLSDVLSRISQAAGVTVVADSTLANEKVGLPAEPTTPANFEAQVAALVESLPKGATWGKLYLPAPSGRGYKGDDLSEYALAQAKLFGRVGDAPEGTVEVMGKAVPAAQAESVVAALNLKPVYLVTNPAVRAAAGAGAPSGAWAGMSEDQRRQYAQTEARRIASMTPEQRQQAFQSMFGQQGAVMRELFQTMTPEQRQQMFQGMRGMIGNMGGWPSREGGGRGQRGGLRQ